MQHLPFPPQLDWQQCGVTADACRTLRRLIALITAVRTREGRILTSRKPNDDNRSQEPERPFRAAEYVRMSTDHQKYSTENQADAIKRYAAERGIEIVRTYADEGKSGLSVDGRDAFKSLIADVSEGRADFEMILVYDVSRWGRFQDTDESAYYEYICKRAGVRVQYCAEQFENDTAAQSLPLSRA
jgi:predicted site-specific integrase-resolvase